MVTEVKGIDDAINIGKTININSKKESEKFIEQMKTIHNLTETINQKNFEESSKLELAMSFLHQCDLIDYSMGYEFNKLTIFQESFYRYNGKFYDRLSDNKLKSLIMKWAAEAHAGLAKRNTRDEIFAILQGICTPTEEHKVGSWLDDDSKKIENYVCVKNGILDLSDKKEILIPHSPLYFNTTIIPIEYKENARSDNFSFYLNRVQPNTEEREVIQEWTGLNLIYDTTFERFVLLIGEGANGKSVYLTVLKSLLGKGNYSCVPLESFSPDKPFSLVATVNKKTNIIEELNQFTKTSEGWLKQFVSGQEMQVQEKHKPAFDMKPTARITACSNTLPSFYDQSNGLWRRLLYFPWEVTIPKAERNRDFLNEKYWENELPGILNWALEGLFRLRERGFFNETERMELFKSEFQKERNPAKVFLLENYIYSEDSKIPDTIIYQHYINYCRSINLAPLSKANFTREVKRIFPQVKKSKNAYSIDKSAGRCRFWIGISQVNDTETQ